MAMFSVGGDDRVIVRERRDRPGGHGFFADIEVEEAADFPELIEFRRPFLEAADSEHLPQKLQPLSAVYNGRHFFSLPPARCQRSAFSVRRTALSDADCLSLIPPASRCHPRASRVRVPSVGGA